MKIFKTISIVCAIAAVAICTNAQNNVAEEVAWMIGDEPIYKSEIEEAYAEMLQEGRQIKGNPYCFIPEQIAIQRLFLHQAELDTIEANISMVQSQVDSYMSSMVAQLGGRDKLEQYFRMPYMDYRQKVIQTQMDNQRMQMVQQELTKHIKPTPSEVRRYFNTLPADSLPFVPLQVEAQIIILRPNIPREEIDDVKAYLRDLTERINRGEIDFGTAANFYSKDPGNDVLKNGGEIGFKGRGELTPEYAAVAFNLNDPKKVSKIVETEYGFHIIQLIEKRGDRVNTRHILRIPQVAQKDVNIALERLDSLRTDIVENKTITFDDAVRYYSQDKDTKYNKGTMFNENDYGSKTTRFAMSDLPAEVAQQISVMEVGDISQPFTMINPKNNRKEVAIVRLRNRIPAHRANLGDDYQLILNMYENHKRQEIIENWIQSKIKDTYVRIEDGWRNCDFQYKWVK